MRRIKVSKLKLYLPWQMSNELNINFLQNSPHTTFNVLILVNFPFDMI